MTKELCINLENSYERLSAYFKGDYFAAFLLMADFIAIARSQDKTRDDVLELVNGVWNNFFEVQ